MCHIGTWSTRYCMRTAEKVWRSKLKKMVCRVSKNDTRHITSLPSVRRRHLTKNFKIILKNPLFAECQPSWHSAKRLLCRAPNADTRQTVFIFFFLPPNFFCSPHIIPGTLCSSVAHFSNFFYISLIYFI